MKCQILFCRKNYENIISLSSTESAHSIISVKAPTTIAEIIRIFFFPEKISLEIPCAQSAKQNDSHKISHLKLSGK